MADPVTVSISFGEIEVKLKGPESFVRTEIERLAAIISSKPQADKVLDKTSEAVLDEEKMSELQLLNSKKPRGHAEIVTVLAFALKYNHSQDEFTEEDLRRAYIRVKERPPKSVGQALRDARNKFDYIEYGTMRGTYRISQHGDRMVRFDLPRSETSVE